MSLSPLGTRTEKGAFDWSRETQRLSVVPEDQLRPVRSFDDTTVPLARPAQPLRG